MEHLIGLGTEIVLFALAVALLAGVIKGIVGFAMPMVIISGLSTVLDPQIALAGLIVPTVVTNGFQAFRFGWREVRETVSRFRVFLITGGVCLALSAQLVPQLDASTMLLIIGFPVTLFAVQQLFVSTPVARGASKRLEVLLGGVAGLVGGLSGIWGPPTVAYLTAIGTEKRQHMIAQGVIYGLGAVLLFGAHLGSGVLNAQTLPLSLALVVPGLVGMWLGSRISDRFEPKTFRRATLVVLVLGGLNLIRRGLLG